MKLRNRILKEGIHSKALLVQLAIRIAIIEELDVDLSRIFEGIPIDKVLDSQLNEVMRIQEMRCAKQSVGRR